MSEQSGGPGWWQASDGLWYRPEQHPNYQPPQFTPPPPPPPALSPQPQFTPPPPAHPPTGGEGADGAAGTRPWYKKKRYILPLALLILIVIGQVAGGGNDKTSNVASIGTATTVADDPVTTTPPQTTAPTDPPTTTPPTTTPPTTADPFAGETVSQRNARNKAADYLDYSAFSRSGLIKQLEYEGFSTADATYGTDAIKADWFEQAAKKAADYMEYSSFSRSGLIRQLEYEGFTRAQAEHGADSVGL